MAVPTQDTTIVADDKQLFTSAYRSQATLNAMLESFLNRAQDLENAIWAVINIFLLDNANGIWLDWFGKIVGQPRDNLSDTDFRIAIRLRILANKSYGLSEDVIKIASLLANPNKAYYLDVYPASFIIEAWNINGALPAASLLTEARATGTYGVFDYSTWPASDVVRFSSRYYSGAGNGTWSSRYGGVPNAGRMGAAVALLAVT